MDWKEREQERLNSGEYRLLIPEVAMYCLPEHYAHCGNRPVYYNKFPIASTIAFTPNEHKGKLDIQTRIRVGTYLMTYVPTMTASTAMELEERQLMYDMGHLNDY